MRHLRRDYDRFQDPAGKIPADEPVLIFRAQDVWAPFVARYYATLVRMDGNEVFFEALESWAEEIERWQRAHPDRVKPPDVPSGALRAPTEVRECPA